MILYLDTSALVKLYAEEEGTGTVEQAVEKAEAVATSVVAYAEARAAFARKLREGVFSLENRDDAVGALAAPLTVYPGDVIEVGVGYTSLADGVYTDAALTSGTITWPLPCCCAKSTRNGAARILRWT